MKLKPIAAAVSLLALSPALAVANDDVERIEVTGSHIKRTDMEGPSPILAISEEDIRNAGAQDVSELLAKLPVSGAGTFSTQGNDSDDTGNGGSAISLRGLGADSTLVLLNGRRISVSAFAKEIDTAFVDINSIPLAAIARVEILKDGASATYGSDAIAGVVNIILKKDFEGFEVTASIGDTSEGGGQETTAAMLWGTQGDNSHTTVVLDYFQRDETLYADRDYSKSANQSGRGGIDFRSSAGNPGSYSTFSRDEDGAIVSDGNWTPDPNCPADLTVGPFCRYDYAPFMTQTPETERVGLMVMQQYHINEQVEAFAELTYQHNNTLVRGAASPSFGEFTMAADNPLFVSGAATNPFPGEDITMRRRLTETLGRVKEVETDNARMVLGLKGDVFDWDWQLAYTYSRSRSNEYGTRGFVWTPALQAAIDSGEFNPFSTTNSAEVLDQVTVNTSRDGKSTTKAFDGKISGELFDYGLGTAALAVGFEYREESLADNPDELFLRGEIFGTEATQASGARDQTSLFAELALPLGDTFEAQLALRHEDYSDFGTNTSPKIALRWAPIDTLALRASWGEAFRAPSLVQLGLGSTQESPGLVDNTRCPLTGEEFDCSAQERTVIFSGNPDLQPEESTSYNIGAIWEVTDAWSLSVDYWNYDQDNLITSDTQKLLDDNGTNPAIVKREPTVNGVPGQIIEIYDSFINLGGQQTDGIDFDTAYLLKTNGAGDFNFSYNLTYVLSFDEIGADGSRKDLNGEYQHPDVRWTAAVDWQLDSYAAAARINYIGEVNDDVDAGATGTIDSMTTLDLNASYLLNHWRFTVGANNVLDEEPPFSAATFMGYDTKTYSAQGRFVYAEVAYRF
ncbi:TonB-dependent receptor [Ferrimonas senticii]|uniref:TonB-dependent receptor n=1 Tax=Ferrimonas senticii TaxID=394566 RepID=UPI000412D757|nr:TonB-dependent receptor [Ferrimonas senticii]